MVGNQFTTTRQLITIKSISHFGTWSAYVLRIITTHGPHVDKAHEYILDFFLMKVIHYLDYVKSSLHKRSKTCRRPESINSESRKTIFLHSSPISIFHQIFIFSSIKGIVNLYDSFVWLSILFSFSFIHTASNRPNYSSINILFQIIVQNGTPKRLVFDVGKWFSM